MKAVENRKNMEQKIKKRWNHANRQKRIMSVCNMHKEFVYQQKLSNYHEIA